MALAIRAGKAPKAAPTPPQRASFVLGSRPGSLRAAPPPRIKPGPANTTNYAKVPAADPNPVGASFGNTAMTGMS